MNDENIKKIKLWKLESYSYQKNVVEPLSQFLKLPVAEIEDLITKNLDMIRVESSHSSAEQAKIFRLEKKFQVDLGLDYFLQIELLSKEQIDKIIEDFSQELEKSGKLDFDADSPEYQKLLVEAREKIIKILEEK